ncbi:hypothetical protein B0H11DRAFT_1911171 [Mycena galericulata]|nr:hypothetical protein B0H11DRAFT_1911171 [Mycena galericulata]
MEEHEAYRQGYSNTGSENLDNIRARKHVSDALYRVPDPAKGAVSNLGSPATALGADADIVSPLTLRIASSPNSLQEFGVEGRGCWYCAQQPKIKITKNRCNECTLKGVLGNPKDVDRRHATMVDIKFPDGTRTTIGTPAGTGLRKKPRDQIEDTLQAWSEVEWEQRVENKASRGSLLLSLKTPRSKSEYPLKIDIRKTKVPPEVQEDTGKLR